MLYIEDVKCAGKLFEMEFIIIFNSLDEKNLIIIFK